MAETKTASLTVLGGPLAGTQCELPETGTLTIGSSPGSTLYLDLPEVSPYHARVVVEGGRISVHDTGSSRTVHVNDSTLDPAGTELRNGDILWLGMPGDDDVVMLQCILPKRAAPPAALTPPGFLADAAAAAPTPEIETVALWATEPAPEPLARPAWQDEPVSIDEAAPVDPAEPEIVSSALPEPVSFAEEFAAEAPPDDATFATETPAEVAPTLLMGSLDEGVEAVDPEAFTPEPAFEPAVAPPPEPAPTPAQAPAQPAVGAGPAAPRAPREARPSTPSRPTARPLPPGASQRVRPAPRRAEPEPEPQPESTDEPTEPAPSTRPPMLLAVGGFMAVVALAAGGWLAWRTLAGRGAEPAATPAPVDRATEPLPLPPTAAPAPEAATPEPLGAATPPPFATPLPPPVTAPLPASTPTPRPTPTPRATPAASTTAATPPPEPSGPSPEQLRAQQVAGLVGQAEAALASRQYDAALAHVDGALRLEPGHPQATSLRSDLVRRRDLAKRRFVPGRTLVDSEKTRKDKASGGLVGFDVDDKAPDFMGRIEFEMTPASGIEASDAWTLRVFVMNQGKKPIRVQGLTLVATINGAGSGAPVAAPVREIAPQQRVQVAESTGAWRDGTSTWVAEATLTAPKNETLKNTLTWK